MARAKKTTAMLDPLDAMLTRLQLTGIRDQLDSLLDEAGRANLSARETLALLCEREIARKDHRRIDMALKLARGLADDTIEWCGRHAWQARRQGAESVAEGAKARPAPRRPASDRVRNGGDEP